MMEELEKIQEATDHVTDIQKRYNENSKNVAYLLGKNLTLFVCILLPFVMIGFIWTEFGDVVFNTHTLADAVVTIVMFTVGEIMMTRLGSDGGKLDPEYLEAKGELDELLTKTFSVGTTFLGVFCDWQIDVELEQATHIRLRVLKLTRKTFDEVKELTPAQLEKRFGKRKAKKIRELIDLEPIELNEAILLYNGEYSARGGVPESGDEYLHKRSHMITTMLTCTFSALLTISIAITLTSDVTLARVIYTIFKLTMLLFRMAKGYDRGAKAYNTIEVKQLKAKSNYLRRYINFVIEKQYLKLIDKYDELKAIVKTECATASDDAATNTAGANGESGADTPQGA